MSAPVTRNLTILLTDIKGFTDKTSHKSRSEIQEMLDRHKEIVLPVLEAKGGKLVKTIGDAFLMTYESPTDAVLAGVSVQEALREHNRGKTDGDRLEVRIAINVGEVNLADNDVFGEPVNITARIESVAEAGEVFFTEAVYWAMNKTEVPSSEVGLLQLKGIREKIRVYKVKRELPVEESAVDEPPAAPPPAPTSGTAARRHFWDRLKPGSASSSSGGPASSLSGSRELPSEAPPKARLAAVPSAASGPAAAISRRAVALLLDGILCWLMMGAFPIGNQDQVDVQYRADRGHAAKRSVVNIGDKGLELGSGGNKIKLDDSGIHINSGNKSIQLGDQGIQVDKGNVNVSIGDNGINVETKPETGFGTLAQSVPAGPYRGHAVRFTGFIKTRGADGAALWLRADDADGKRLRFDNMGDKTLRGDNEWTRYTARIDVPARAEKLLFGIVLTGKGEAWADDLRLGADGAGVPARRFSCDDTASWMHWGTRPQDYQMSDDKDVTRGGGPSTHVRYFAPSANNPIPSSDEDVVYQKNGLKVSKRAEKKSWFPLFWVIYSTLFLTLAGTTPGKKVLKLRVVTMKGERPGWWHCFARSLSMLFSFYILGLGFFWALWEKDRRTWHDLLCDTRVVAAE